jgi:hypothetical protein
MTPGPARSAQAHVPVRTNRYAFGMATEAAPQTVESRLHAPEVTIVIPLLNEGATVTVRNGRQLAVRNILTFDVEPCGRIGESGLVVRAQLDRSAESSAGSSGGTRCLLSRRRRCGGGLLTHRLRKTV